MAKKPNAWYKQFVEERDALLRELDVDKMITFMVERNMNPFGYYDRKNLLAGMHKARMQLEAFSNDERAYSRSWLLRNGFALPVAALYITPSESHVKGENTK